MQVIHLSCHTVVILPIESHYFNTNVALIIGKYFSKK
ncbi:hypothetical protein J2750_001905 [Methanococcoides alaskense]|uniref:Uncharacterized protein n=1 Tax=Methanococcoides alaskense TaxID=325778 RepID=A0AA90U104_9EURY|nr:hypothetical protein [Methanococcoides alaskense]